MTTPDERRRNLIWGREMLEELAQDSRLLGTWRAEALELLAGYPPPAFLLQFDAGDPTELEPHVSTLVKARLLFERVGASQTCSEERRYSLQVVLRHFY
ncbi:MAG: hypothetical protein HY020_06925 [Burkholderiales bacterium]|nr:hypothetical protein [Burkholderiales bacterium]